MKVKAIIISLILIFTIDLVSGQTEKLHEKIYWQGIQEISFGDMEKHQVIMFENAIFESTDYSLPLYFNKFEQKEGSDFSIELENKVFETVSPAEANYLHNINFVQTALDIQVNHEIVSKKVFKTISFVPIIKNLQNNSFEKLVSFDIIFKDTFYLGLNNLQQTKTYAANSVLSSGNWYKIAVNKSGVYKLTYNDFQNMNLQVTNPANIRIFGNGAGMLPQANAKFRYDDLMEMPILVVDGNDGSFDANDYVLFYGENPTKWKLTTAANKYQHTTHLYADETCYFVTTNNGAGLRISSQSSSSLTPNQSFNKYEDYAVYEKDQVNLIKSGREWFGEVFDMVTQYSFNFSFPDIDMSSPVFLNTSVLARASLESSFTFNANGNSFNTTVGYVNLTGNGDYAKMKNTLFSFIPNSPAIQVNVTFNKPNPSAIGWLNFLQLNVKRNLIYRGNQLLFRNSESIGNGNISEFIISSANSNQIIWEVTNPIYPKNQQYQVDGSNIKFVIPTDSLREFIVFEPASAFIPSLKGKVENQNLHGLGKYDLIVVTHKDLLTEAERLANMHRQRDNMQVLVVTVDLIYNEFSSGVQDVTAIRDFVKMFYDRAGNNANLAPKYLLLFGDGSYDNKNRLPENTNMVPTFQSAGSIKFTDSYVTDDYFGLLDNNEGEEAFGALDVGIGRIPVKNIEEARFAVDKILRYVADYPLIQASDPPNVVSNLADWRNYICFLADDEDGNLHVSQADSLARMVTRMYPDFNVDKIYFDAYRQYATPGGHRYPEATEAINRRVNKGALVISYTGHGGELGLAQERVLEISNIESWRNQYNMPAFFTATCEFSRFDDPERTSAGELVFLNSKGGGIALYTTTRLSYSHSNFSLTRSFFSNVFNKVDNEYLRMGDLLKIAKIANGSSVNNRNFVLLGDPALRLAYPKYKVSTTHINNQAITSTPDTLKALSRVTIHGEILDQNNQLLTNFNGILTPTIFDKVVTYSTLANDPQTSYPFSFDLQKNIIYKGNVSVVNGQFNFSFVVPKDIAYRYGNGRISYYAQNGNVDANGYFSKFIIGGTAETYAEDNQGPEISLFLNDTTFKFGGLTDENPMLLGKIYDVNGINTVGNGIGHDIIAVLDETEDKEGSLFVLNDYYEAALDCYQHGTVKFPFEKLSEGRHNVKLKVWDVYNNSATAYTEFVVAGSAKLALSYIMNYPNPFRYSTTISFEHNQPGQDLDIEVLIYNFTGHLVKKINVKSNTKGFQAEPIVWDGTSDNGSSIGPGLYVYKIRVKAENGTYGEASQKLVYIK